MSNKKAWIEIVSRVLIYLHWYDIIQHKDITHEMNGHHNDTLNMENLMNNIMTVLKTMVVARLLQ